MERRLPVAVAGSLACTQDCKLYVGLADRQDRLLGDMSVGRLDDKQFAGNRHKAGDTGPAGMWGASAGLGKVTECQARSSFEGQADKHVVVYIRPFHQVDDTGAPDRADKVDKPEVVDMEGMVDLLLEVVGTLLTPLVAQLEQFYLAWSPAYLPLVPLEL